MTYRKSMSRRASRRSFGKSAKRVNRRNTTMVHRGGRRI